MEIPVNLSSNCCHHCRASAPRTAIATAIQTQRARQEELRAAHTALITSVNADIAAVRSAFDTESAKLDTEEQELRAANAGVISQAEQQLAALQLQSQTMSVTGDSQIEALHQRIRSRQNEIEHIRQQIAATDIGSYRFVARAFSASADDVVKWLMLALVLVFDPLAVSLAVAFNVAILHDPRRRAAAPLPVIGPTGTIAATDPDGVASPRRSRIAFFGTSLLLLVLGAGGVTVAAQWGVSSLRHQTSQAHSTMVPADSFAVITLRPDELQRSAHGRGFADWLGQLAGQPAADALALLSGNGFDPAAPIYAFARFPEQRDQPDQARPVILCGLVARVTNPKTAEASLSQLADQINRNLRASIATAPALTRNRAMIRHGQGRYMDPEGGFFTFGLTDRAAMLLVEFEGDPQSPRVEPAIQRALVVTSSSTGPTVETVGRTGLPPRATGRDGAMTVWLDASRFFNALPASPSAQHRFQQLQSHLAFELTLNIQPAGQDQLRVQADYRYSVDRFGRERQPSGIQRLAEVGTDATSGLAGRFMERCADTLDYDSLIERLRAALAARRPATPKKCWSKNRSTRLVMPGSH